MFVCKKRHFELSFLRHSERSEESKNINFFGIAENKAATLGSFGHKGLRMTEKKEGLRMTVKECFGRSMIEMLGVLAIIGVLSIVGITMYRRAVNNHHANTILDDVNRFAFVITEKGSYPEGEDIPKGDFRESGIYMLKGHQAYAGQYSITALNVPKGICEILIDKGIIDYKVGVVTAGGSVENEILYDTLHTDICQKTNDVAFYFGDTSGVCNDPDEDGYTPCTENSDCCGGEFCAFQNASGYTESEKGKGQCWKLSSKPGETHTFADGHTWTRSLHGMTWWSGKNWCAAQGLSPVSRSDIGCGNIPSGSDCASDTFVFIAERWRSGYHWFEPTSATTGCCAYIVRFPSGFVNSGLGRNGSAYAFCH